MSDHSSGEDSKSCWRPPRRFGGGLAVVALAVTALIGGLATPAGSPAVETAVPVGSLSTSMVEMLDAGDATTPMGLEALRDDIFEGAAFGDGSGVDVALIDTGVAPVEGLDGVDKVLHGPDLSMEANSPEVAFLDTYGHGTHLAGIIAGERSGARGIAPGARIVSVKVAGHDGVTTVPQVVAAIDWVVEHRNTDGLNIRVLNLSLGQAGVADHVGDYLSAAVERAWDAGIFVVVAAGNSGDSQPHLDSPAIDPYVMAVGATDPASNGDKDMRVVPSWSAQGDGTRNPDAVIAGRSIASYRVPGSTVDVTAPSARYGTDLFLGSGTSQSAAVTSGLAAAIIGNHPTVTPDQVKATLLSSAIKLELASTIKEGHGILNGDDLRGLPATNVVVQIFPDAAGPGTGIVIPTGSTWSGGTWSGATWSGSTWSGSTWSGGTWSGATWSGATWSGSTWSGATWSGSTWSGATWSGSTWSGATWSGSTWSGNGWS